MATTVSQSAYLLLPIIVQKCFLNYFLIHSICDLSLTREPPLSPQLPVHRSREYNELQWTERNILR